MGVTHEHQGDIAAGKAAPFVVPHSDAAKSKHLLIPLPRRRDVVSLQHRHQGLEPDARAPCLWILREMPEKSGGIEDIGNAQAPRFELRRTRARHVVTRGEIEAGDMGPPIIQVVDQHVHDEIQSPPLGVMRLQEEPVLAKSNIRQAVPEGLHAKAKVGIELLAAREVLRRHEGA
jgi:hypothetical protein